jgi:hypothetical protein
MVTLGSELVLLSQKAWWTANSPAAIGARGDNLEVDGYGFACSAVTCTDSEDWRLQAPAPAEGVEGSEVTGGKGAAASCRHGGEATQEDALGRGRGDSSRMAPVGLETMLVWRSR